MAAVRRLRRSRRNKSTQWIVLAMVLFSAMSCIAPVLYASTDCSRWLAEYKQGILQRRAARRLRAAKYRLTAIVHKPAHPHPHPLHHRMGPMESLLRFQIYCCDLDQQPTLLDAAVPPLMPLEPKLVFLSMAEVPPELPPPGEANVAAVVPPLADVPTTPVQSLSSPTVTPEPGSFLLVFTGGIALMELARRKRAVAQDVPARA